MAAHVPSVRASLSSMALGLALAGCNATVYRAPIGKFQTAVTATTALVRPVLVDANQAEVRARLTDKVLMGAEWGSEDLAPAVPAEAIQIRLDALSAITDYARALDALVNGKPAADMSRAAAALGATTQGLSDRLATLGAAPGREASARAAKVPDLGAPLSSLSRLFGTVAIERLQRQGIERAILDGAEPISQLLVALQKDLRSLSVAARLSIEPQRVVLLRVYQAKRKGAVLKDEAALAEELAKENARLEALRTVSLDGLLGDVRAAHEALVAFARSGGKPKDIAGVAAEIDVLTSHVALVRDTLEALETASLPRKRKPKTRSEQPALRDPALTTSLDDD